MLFSIVCMFVSDECIVMSSAYVVKFTFGGGEGMSAVYMLNSMGERTPPCGTPDLNCCCLDVCCLKVVYAFLPLM